MAQILRKLTILAAAAACAVAGQATAHAHDFFAQADDGTVHYLGQRVDNIRDGRITDHRGSWLYGRDTNELGVLMAADPHPGRHWLSEDAAPITVEHDRVVDRRAESRPAGAPTGTRSRFASTRCRTGRSSSSSTRGVSA